MASVLILPALMVHVGAGLAGLLSGAAALAVRKGSSMHRICGSVFVVSMLTMSAMATYLAALIPQRGNLVGGVFTFYLVATAWRTAKRRPDSPFIFERIALFGALGTAALGLTFGLMAAGAASGEIDGTPFPSLFIFVGLAAFAVVLDARIIRARIITPRRRMRRHIWRMCTGLFIATGSFFLGQQKVMPSAIQGSPVLAVLAGAPLVAMIFWLVRVRFLGAQRTVAAA